MSGLFVLIALKGPRISDGAFGFMSNVTNWLGAPRLKIMMQDLLSFDLSTAPRACKAANLERVRPMALRVPTCRKSRPPTPHGLRLPDHPNSRPPKKEYAGRRALSPASLERRTLRES